MTYFLKPRTDLPPAKPIQTLQAHFLQILPRIETHAKIHFRWIRCPQRRDDAIAECVALAWKWFVKLDQRGKDGTQFASVLATYAVKHVRAGRRLIGQEKGKDTLSPLAQARHGFRIESLPGSPRVSREQLYGEPHGQRGQDAFEERLQDNTRTPPPDQAAFRIDFITWLKSPGNRNRAIAEAMMHGARTQELARTFGITQGRVSQLRRWFQEEWTRFSGEGDAS